MRFVCDQDVYAVTVRFIRSLGHNVVTAVVDVHKELERVAKTYSEDDLRKAFVVVEVGRHRFRRLS